MTDLEKSRTHFITELVKHRHTELKYCVVVICRDGLLGLRAKDTPISHLKRDGLVVVDLPELAKDNETAIAQLGLAIGKRLERFERGMKSNAGRTSDVRQKIAQNAIQKRWSARRIDD